MAIPISWPSSDDVEDSYRSLDLLLEQLLVTVRQVLVQRRRQSATLTNTRQRSSHQVPRRPDPVVPTPPPASQPARPEPTRLPDILGHLDQTTRLPDILGHLDQTTRLPDILDHLDQSTSECESPRPKSAETTPVTLEPAAPPSVWVRTGAELRHIADSFRVHNGVNQDTLDGKTQLAKETSLLALVCPAIGKSLWTTLALLIGWGLFSSKR